ncbi:hypothetical protein N7532_001824 [Penicillium argentinense]|uniref:Uncharacterized protein n=1 Tax=Penicillium argentinense TaxID=1131581 RepID=A0A9W9G393_9EURO|nr:uncharacterized protein N7532_001824 [Penicillium argentinense]KAJ5111289.1 hypothetical protein N7532_001824 [Penicillium argentinense]
MKRVQNASAASGWGPNALAPTLAKAVHAVSPYPTKSRVHLPHASIDETVSPKLVAGALDQQYREWFCAFIDAHFPVSTYAYISRIDVNWFNVARNHEGSSGKALDWALRSLGSLHIGRVHDNEGQVMASREMYGRALRHLFWSINKPSLVAADETLAAAILLGGYEMVNPTGQGTWLLHSRGISGLFCLRGPQAHVRGLGRNLLASFRGFLVFEALTRGEACFLERQEWRAITSDTIKAEQQLGKACRLCELIEYAFYEIAQCPGFLASTRAVVAYSPTKNMTKKHLIYRMTRCQKALRDLQSQLSTGVRVARQSNNPENGSFIGLIPPSVADTLGVFSLEGVSSAIALIQQLLSVLESDRTRRTMKSLSVFPANDSIWNLVKDSTVIARMTRGRSNLQLAGPQAQEGSETWLDPLCMSMGMQAAIPPI